MLLAGSKPTGSRAIGALVAAYVGIPGSTSGGIPASNVDDAGPGTPGSPDSR